MWTDEGLSSLLAIHHLFTDLCGLCPVFSAAGLLVNDTNSIVFRVIFLHGECAQICHRSDIF